MTSKISCLFGWHRNTKIVNIFHFNDTSFNLNIPSTQVTYYCKDCKKVYNKTLNCSYKKFNREDLE